ncbi:unnamed protein product [Notodromas monacha]|uniref:Peptidase S1 domain-containing protein n=1 Tax=Notodromas monacha TaxID=399045 RepID=A0A7R9BPQ6_9CRUS|nr:unnamed protein product [Notodromas monacha]CAG0919158.1 unnamed protein product [Notodromas monacha]
MTCNGVLMRSIKLADCEVHAAKMMPKMLMDVTLSTDAAARQSVGMSLPIRFSWKLNMLGTTTAVETADNTNPSMKAWLQGKPSRNFAVTATVDASAKFGKSDSAKTVPGICFRVLGCNPSPARVRMMSKANVRKSEGRARIVKRNKRYVGGTAISDRSKHPYLARVNVATTVNGVESVQPHVAGTLISSRHVLTSAYQVHPEELGKIPANFLVVVLGDVDSNIVEVTEQIFNVEIPSVIFHPMYNHMKGKAYEIGLNNLAVLPLNQDVARNEFVYPILVDLNIGNYQDYDYDYVGIGRYFMSEAELQGGGSCPLNYFYKEYTVCYDMPSARTSCSDKADIGSPVLSRNNRYDIMLSMYQSPICKDGEQTTNVIFTSTMGATTHKFFVCKYAEDCVGLERAVMKIMSKLQRRRRCRRIPVGASNDPTRPDSYLKPTLRRVRCSFVIAVIALMVSSAAASALKGHNHHHQQDEQEHSQKFSLSKDPDVEEEEIQAPPQTFYHSFKLTEPYEFAFAVNDDSLTNYQQRQEISDGKVIKGSYQVVDPDGFIRKVVYTADAINGFEAKVSREPTDIKIVFPEPRPEDQQQPEAEISLPKQKHSSHQHVPSAEKRRPSYYEEPRPQQNEQPSDYDRPRSSKKTKSRKVVKSEQYFDLDGSNKGLFIPIRHDEEQGSN